MTTNDDDNDSTTTEESSQLLLSDSSNDNRIDPQAHMNGQGAAGLQLTAVTPDCHICHNYESIASCSDVVSIGDNATGLVEAPPYPLKPVDVADNKKCTYCGYMGKRCRRVRHGDFCVKLVLRYYNNNNKETYNEDYAKENFLLAYVITSELMFYVGSQCKHVRNKPLTTLPKCMELMDLDYVLKLVQFRQWEEAARRTVGCTH